MQFTVSTAVFADFHANVPLAAETAAVLALLVDGRDPGPPLVPEPEQQGCVHGGRCELDYARVRWSPETM